VLEVLRKVVAPAARLAGELLSVGPVSGFHAPRRGRHLGGRRDLRRGRVVREGRTSRGRRLVDWRRQAGPRDDGVGADQGHGLYSRGQRELRGRALRRRRGRRWCRRRAALRSLHDHDLGRRGGRRWCRRRTALRSRDDHCALRRRDGRRWCRRRTALRSLDDASGVQTDRRQRLIGQRRGAERDLGRRRLHSFAMPRLDRRIARAVQIV